MQREVEAIEAPDKPEEAIMHHKPGHDWVDKLSALKGMNRVLAERMTEDGLPDDADTLSRRYGLDILDAENLLKEVRKW